MNDDKSRSISMSSIITTLVYHGQYNSMLVDGEVQPLSSAPCLRAYDEIITIITTDCLTAA